MNAQITSIENLIATDPGGRNIFALALPDQLRLAAQSLRLARRVGIVTGFHIVEASSGETDGPPGSKILGEALRRMGIEVDYITDESNKPLLSALGLSPICDVADYLGHAGPTHLVAVERAGRGQDGKYRNLRGVDITHTTAALDDLFLEGTHRGLTTIGIGDGGNEIGMGKVFTDALATVNNGAEIATTVATDFCIVAGVSNWGAMGLAGALSVLAGRDLLPSADDVARDLEQIVTVGGAVDGITHRREPTVDGQPLSSTLRMLEQIRRHIAPSPLERSGCLTVGILGYGLTGRAAAKLLINHGHRVLISDKGSVTVDPGMEMAGVETGGHTIRFLESCDLVVASPGVAVNTPILDAIHRHGIHVISELELAYQIATETQTTPASVGSPAPSLIAVTGTIGKRSTVELLQRIFESSVQPLAIGGNRGRPLSDLLTGHDSTDDSIMSPPQGSVATAGPPDDIALAVSSFQLESVVHFRPHIAVLLNIAEEHLDRHQSISEYVRIKSRVFMNQRPDDVLILPFDDPRLRALARRHQGRTLWVSPSQPVDRGAWLVDGAICVNINGQVERIRSVSAGSPGGVAEFPMNLLSAVLIGRLSGLDADGLGRSLHDLSGAGLRS